jgi:hypothetical protein
MMVHRRTGVVVLTLLTLLFLLTSHADSMTTSSFAKHEFPVRGEFTTPHRLSGSVFSSTGDPDEIATYNPPGGGRMNGEISDLIDAQLGGADWANNRVGVCSAFLRYLVYFFRVTR